MKPDHLPHKHWASQVDTLTSDGRFDSVECVIYIYVIINKIMLLSKSSKKVQMCLQKFILFY